MFTMIFSGYLTKDATFSIYGERSVLNLNIAVNFITGKKDSEGKDVKEVLFFNCSRWSKSNVQPKLLNFLKKGQKIIVSGNRMQVSQTESNGEKYINLNVMVQNIELIGGVKQSQEQEQHIEQDFDDYDLPF